jgi:hypothetical protein
MVMIKAKKYIGSLVVALLFSIGLVFSAAPAQASPADGNYAQCYGGTTVYDWTGKDPSTCQSGSYVLLKDWQVVLRIEPGRSDVWGAVKQGYAAAQQWCSQNSLTCTVMTGIGVAIVSPLIVAQS